MASSVSLVMSLRGVIEFARWSRKSHSVLIGGVREFGSAQKWVACMHEIVTALEELPQAYLLLAS